MHRRSRVPIPSLVRAARYKIGDDFVIATGRSHSVAEFAAAALASVGITDWEQWVETDPQLVRPADATELVGDASKAKRELGWQGTVDFTELVGAMVNHDLALLTA